MFKLFLCQLIHNATHSAIRCRLTVAEKGEAPPHSKARMSLFEFLMKGIVWIISIRVGAELGPSSAIETEPQMLKVATMSLHVMYSSH